MTELTLSPLLNRILPLLAGIEMPVFLVGGAVRDALLGRASHDLDFAVPERAIELAFLVADALQWPAYVLDQERDVGRVVVSDSSGAGESTMLDFVRFRGPDLQTDLRGRDFTVNALAIQVADPQATMGEYRVIDYFGGLEDLATRRLQAVHGASLREDPVRALRAVRLAQSLSFTIAAETAAAVQEAAALLPQSSPERVRDELLKMIGLAHPDTAVQEMIALGLLAIVLPEIAALSGVVQSPPHREDVLAHTVSVLRWLVSIEEVVWSDDDPLETASDQALVQGLAQRLREVIAPHRQGMRPHFARRVDGGLDGRTLFRLGALFHDSGKKATQSVDDGGRIRFYDHERVGANLAATRLNALALSNEAISYVRKIVENHMRPLLLANSPSLPSRRAVYRYFRAAKSAGLDVALLSLADHLAKYDDPGPEEEWQRVVGVVAHLLDSYFTAYEEVVVPPRLVDGKVLMDALGLDPGPEIGRLLGLIQEAQAAGEVADAEGALALAREQLMVNGKR